MQNQQKYTKLFTSYLTQIWESKSIFLSKKYLNKTLIISLLGSGGGIFAEDLEEVYIGESVVSASGYEQDIKNAPATINIITKEELQSRPIRDLGEALQDIPGVAISVDKTGQNNISIRGLSSKYTLILIDGKRATASESMVANGFTPPNFMPPISMIERIEVIRGPASVLYGSDAMGGVINIITKKIPDKTVGSIALETRLQENRKNWGDVYGVNGFITTPLIDKVLALNLRGKYITSGDNKFYKSDVKGYSNSGSDANPFISHSMAGYTSANAGFRLTYNIDSSNSMYLDGEMSYGRQGALNTSSSQIISLRDYYRANGILSHSGKYGWGNMESYIQFADSQEIPLRASHQTGGYTINGKNKANAKDNKNVILSSNWNNSYDFDDYGVLVGSAGLYYSYENILLKSSKYNNHINQAAFFGEAEYIPMELISTQLGLRVNFSDKYKVSANPRLYININPNSNLTFKLGISSGMKAPNLLWIYDGYTESGSNGSNTYIYGNSNVKPEYSWNYEISTIIDFPKIVNVTLTGYYTDFRDAISAAVYSKDNTLPDGLGTCGATNCNVYQNVGKARSTGAEVGIRMARFYGIGFDFTYGFAHTKQLSGINKGLPLNLIPQHTASATLSYKYEGFDAYLRWSGKYRTRTTNAHTANSGVGSWYKDVNIVDLGFGYHFTNGVSLNFVINNLLDTNFLDMVTNNGNSITNRYQRMMPDRNYWISLKYDF